MHTTRVQQAQTCTKLQASSSSLGMRENPTTTVPPGVTSRSRISRRTPSVYTAISRASCAVFASPTANFGAWPLAGGTNMSGIGRPK